jgi:hypothetical protein
VLAHGIAPTPFDVLEQGEVCSRRVVHAEELGVAADSVDNDHRRHGIETKLPREAHDLGSQFIAVGGPPNAREVFCDQ